MKYNFLNYVSTLNIIYKICILRECMSVNSTFICKHIVVLLHIFYFRKHNLNITNIFLSL